MALVGGINILLHPYPFIGFTKASMLSAQGRCRAFDASGDGYVRAEGGAVLVLKPLAAAEAAGDPIHAVILASGVNADGARKTGITIPSPAGQAELMRLVGELPDGYRMVFNLFAIEGYDHAEIADLLGCGESTSRSQLAKARRMLQARIAQQDLAQSNERRTPH